jgi:hypothetical protein
MFFVTRMIGFGWTSHKIFFKKGRKKAPCEKNAHLLDFLRSPFYDVYIYGLAAELGAAELLSAESAAARPLASKF